MTRVWSPASCSSSRSISIAASVPGRAGAPLPPGVQSTPANLSPPETAKPRHSSSWSWASTLISSRPASRIFGQLEEVLAGQNDTSGGSSDSEVTDWQAKPCGSAPSKAVITVTPVQKWPSTCRSRSPSTVRGAAAAESTDIALLLRLVAHVGRAPHRAHRGDQALVVEGHHVDRLDHRRTAGVPGGDPEVEGRGVAGDPQGQ